MFTNDDELDLVWYFLCSAADCGQRSTLGGQLDAIEASAYAPGTPKSSVWMAKPKRAFCAREADEERILKAAERERAILRRLNAIEPARKLVLELQYGDAVKVSGLSLSLCQCTQVAYESFERQAAKGARKGKPCEKTVRGWVIRVFEAATTGKSAELADIADAIAAEAKADIDAARAEYGKTHAEPARRHSA